jgi:hypothetical protein
VIPTPENIDQVLDARERTILRRAKIVLAERAVAYALRPSGPATAQAAVAWAMHDLGLMDSLDA